MAVAGQYLGAVGATVRRDAAIFLSYRLRMLSQVLGVLFSLATFYYIVQARQAQRGRGAATSISPSRWWGSSRHRSWPPRWDGADRTDGARGRQL